MFVHSKDRTLFEQAFAVPSELPPELRRQGLDPDVVVLSG